MIGMLGMLAASCSQVFDDPVAGPCEQEKVQVVFTLVTGNNSRAEFTTDEEWHDYENIENTEGTKGNKYLDNKIDPNQMQILICDADNNILAQIDKFLHVQDADDYSIYHIYGEFEADAELLAETSYKIMVFANCPSVSNITIGNSNYLETNLLSPVTSIPMWGVSTLENSGKTAFQPGSTTNLGKILLLRSLAKVEIWLDDDLTGDYTLKNASFNKYNSKINCLPNGYSTAADTKDLLTLTAFKPCSSPVSTLSFVPITDEKGKAKLIAYVPEYEVSSGNELYVTISLEKDGKIKQYTPILFGKEDGTEAWNVVRNHYYSYQITGVNEEVDKDITLEWYVNAWRTFEEINYDFN